jgi:hypothetical protein
MTLAFLMALATIVQQASGTISQNKYDLQLLNAAEIGVDYAVSQFNTYSPCPLDPPAGQSLLQTPLNPAFLPNELAGISVNLTVKNIVAQTDWQSFQQLSSIYSKQLDPNKNVTVSWKNPLSTNVSTSCYRIIESQAVRNGSSRTIRCFLQARFDASPNFSPAAPSTSTGSYFSNPIFSNGLVALLNVGTVNSSGSGITPGSPPIGNNPPTAAAYNLTVATNTQATIGAGTTLAGNLSVLTAMNGDGVPTGTTAGFNSATSGAIDGRLTVNGTYDSSVNATSGNTPQSGNNVLANADLQTGSPNRVGVNNSNPDQAGAGANTPAAQIQMAPAPSQSATTTSFPEITTSSFNVPAGDYAVTDLQTSTFEVPATIGASGQASPVRIFVQDGANQSAVQINSSMMTNASGVDSNLQLWYSGSKPVNINLNGPTFNGVIYAPNATVNITGQGNFTGAVVAGLLNATNTGNVSIDTGLSSNGSANAKAGLTYNLNATGSQIQGWQVVTWQELKP